MTDVFEGLDTSSRIKGVLASRGKTQNDLAELLGVSAETVSARMKSNKWDVTELKTIAAEYGVDPTDLI